MANFEHLIRNAIKAKQADTAEARALVYASSRNALQNIIAKNPSLTPEASAFQQQQLEEVIAAIESEFAAPSDAFADVQTGPAPDANQFDTDDSLADTSAVHEPSVSSPPPPENVDLEPVKDDPLSQQHFAEQAAVPPSVSSGQVEEQSPLVNAQLDDFDDPVVEADTHSSEDLAAANPAPVEPAPVSQPPVEEAPAQQPAAPDPMAELEEILSGGKAPVSPAPEPPIAQVDQNYTTQPVPTVGEQAKAPNFTEHQVQSELRAEPEVVSVSDQTNSVSIDEEAELADYYAPRSDAQPKELPPEFTKRRRSQRRLVWVTIVLLCLGVLAFVGYRIFSDFFNTYIANGGNGSVVISDNASRKDSNSDYINILEPGDLTALSVTDNGKVEIVNEQSNEMIRLMSVRDASNLSAPANPILIRLKPGVIEQVRGKRVTVEIYARSGSGGTSQFTVECRFDNTIGCGRKRFLVGAQPEASIFAFTMEENQPLESSALIAINTDITPAAAELGKGDVLDIVYIRLRTFKDE